MFKDYLTGKVMVRWFVGQRDGGSIPTITMTVRGSTSWYAIYIGDGLRDEPVVKDTGHEGATDLFCSHRLFAMMVSRHLGYLTRRHITKLVDVLVMTTVNKQNTKASEE